MDEKQLLPVRALDTHAPEVVALREKTERLLLQFNTTGNAALLEEVFGQPQLQAMSYELQVACMLSLANSSLRCTK